jgi:exodeoxyribonuclease VII large subunit
MDSATNAPEFSVTELSGAIKRTMEDAFGRVRVRGEIAGYRGPSASGHVYFGLKDMNARIEAVIWKGVFGRLHDYVEEGLEVIATGKITTFPGSSKYQIVIESLEPAGEGALLKQLEDRKKKLGAEGLFAAERKKAIPFLPEVIGVITSPTGAVIRDILHRLTDRFPRHVIVWPVRVQGETSAEEVRRAVIGFNRLTHDDAITRPDVLIVARGGGSLEDLWGFNDEALSRAVADSTIPLISAVGHETDTTLIDFVSDWRAPTPTAAAEKAVPVRTELLLTSDDLGLRLRNAAHRALERRKVLLAGLARALPQAETLLAAQRQRLDHADARLPVAARQGFDLKAWKLAQLQQRLLTQSPAARLARFTERLEGYSKRLATAFDTRLTRERSALLRQRDRLPALETRLSTALHNGLQRRHTVLDGRFAQLKALSHHGVLARGYVVMRGADGQMIRKAADVKIQETVTVMFADGDVTMQPIGAKPRPASATRRTGPAPEKTRQGDLF